MQLTFVILVLCWSLPNSTSHPPIPEWRQSRFIIDNRRNSLFTHHEPREDAARKSSDFRYPPELFPVPRFQKDLNAEASIQEPNFFERYNSLPGGVKKTRVKSSEFGYKEDSRNVSRVVYDPHNPGDETEAPETSTEKRWVPKMSESSTVSGKTNAKSPALGFGVEESTPRLSLGYGRTPWSLKTEEGNQIDEKHVYETRIETVSYHQEVIFNPPKPESNTEEWYQRDEEEEATTYHEPENDNPEDGSYQEPEKNYEEPERNYEEPERNYEEPERNYEEPERNYEEPERNYEEPERNYEPERSLGKPESNYKEQERNYEQHDTMNGKTYPPETDENKNQFGYVVEGRNFRKYRVEERTADGFIVGEFGVVSHDDGTLRGVRYTADSTANPQLIYDTLIKFLSL